MRKSPHDSSLDKLKSFVALYASSASLAVGSWLENDGRAYELLVHYWDQCSYLFLELQEAKTKETVAVILDRFIAVTRFVEAVCQQFVTYLWPLEALDRHLRNGTLHTVTLDHLEDVFSWLFRTPSLS